MVVKCKTSQQGVATFCEVIFVYCREFDHVRISECRDNLANKTFFELKVFDALVKGRCLITNLYDDFYSAAKEFMEWQIYEPEGANELLGMLLVGEDAAHLSVDDKRRLIEEYGGEQRLSVADNGYVIENIAVAVEKLDYADEEPYLVGIVNVDGVKYLFDYHIVTQEMEIHHYSEPSWLDGSCFEKNLPNVVMRNIEEVDSAIYSAVDAFYRERVREPSEEAIEDALAEGWTPEEVGRGYIICCDGEGAEFIARLDCLDMFDGDWMAAEQAERDGFAVIRDKVYEYPYLDTPGNREILKNAEKTNDVVELIQGAHARVVDEIVEDKTQQVEREFG